MKESCVIPELQQRIALYEDMKAYKQLYELFFQRLFRFSCSIVRSREAAEEIVSDVFIKIWQIRSGLADIVHLNVYLYTITKNFSLNHLTKSQRFRIVSLEDIPEESFLHLFTPEDSYISAEIINGINASVNKLPAQCRVIFYMVRDAGLSYKEVASILNISINTVRNQVTIATRKIADSLPLSVKL